MKKFLFRVKGDEVEIASLFPLIETIINKSDKNQVAIVYDDIVNVSHIGLPEGCEAYPISKKQTESLFAAHKYAANLNDVFNIDYYIDFVSDMYSAFLGLAFRATTKVGLQGGPKSFFYQISIPEFVGDFLDEQKASILDSLYEEYSTQWMYPRGDLRELKNIMILFPQYQDEVFISRVNLLSECLPSVNIRGYIPQTFANDFNSQNVSKKIALFTESESVMKQRISEFNIIITDSLVMAQGLRNKGLNTFLICNEEFIFPQWKLMTEAVGCLWFSSESLLSYGVGERIQLKTITDLEDYFFNYQTLRVMPSK